MIKKLLSKLFKSKFDLKEGHAIEFVFESGGIDNYKFVNEFNIPYGRAVAALDIQTELEERTNKKYHIDCYNAIIENLRLGYNDQAAIEAHNALGRMENISNVDLMYKLASVLYIWKDENPYTYDYEFADKKIKHWQKDKDIEGFFFEDSVSRLSSLFRWFENEYIGVHKRSKKRNAANHKASIVHIIREIQKQRVDFNLAITRHRIGDVNYEQLIKMTIFDYYQYIDRVTKILSSEKKNAK